MAGRYATAHSRGLAVNEIIDADWPSSCPASRIGQGARGGAVVDHVLLQSGTTIEETAPSGTGVLRATLENGLRVVVIRDPLVPVATIEENYLVGADETPPETIRNIQETLGPSRG